MTLGEILKIFLGTGILFFSIIIVGGLIQAYKESKQIEKMTGKKDE